MNFVYYILSLIFVLLVVWMTYTKDHKRYQEYLAVIAIYLGLVIAIADSNKIIAASFGTVAICLAAINNHYKGFIGE